MSENTAIDPTDTYVLDDEEVSELDDLGLTGMMKGLADYVADLEHEADEHVEQDPETGLPD